MSDADPRCAMLFELSQCAYRLGVAFGEEAERAEEAGQRLEYFRLFDRCFFAVRVATALELRLSRAPVAARPESTEAPPGREDLRDREDLADAERLAADAPEPRERDEADREREREVEPASLPVLLRTLEDVAADAAVLPGPEPAALPTLRELLAHVAPGPGATPVATVPKPAAGLRARLAGSGAASALALMPPRAPSPGAGLAARRATGPPRR